MDDLSSIPGSIAAIIEHFKCRKDHLNVAYLPEQFLFDRDSFNFLMVCFTMRVTPISHVVQYGIKDPQSCFSYQHIRKELFIKCLIDSPKERNVKFLFS